MNKIEKLELKLDPSGMLVIKDVYIGVSHLFSLVEAKGTEIEAFLEKPENFKATLVLEDITPKLDHTYLGSGQYNIHTTADTTPIAKFYENYSLNPSKETVTCFVLLTREYAFSDFYAHNIEEYIREKIVPGYQATFYTLFEENEY
jgi:hypothetical protein